MAKEIEKIDISEIRMLVHQHAETGFTHTTYDDESYRFHLLMNGDMRAVEESEKLLDASIQGTLSSDPLRNMRYLFIINTGIATRYMIEAGLSQETVFSISDVYIQKADTAKTIKEIRDLNREVWKVFVQTVADFRNKELPECFRVRIKSQLLICRYYYGISSPVACPVGVFYEIWCKYDQFVARIKNALVDHVYGIRCPA